MLRLLSALALLIQLHVVGQTMPESLIRQLPPLDGELDARMQNVIVQMNAFDADSALSLIGDALTKLDPESDLEPRYYLLAFRAEVLYYQGAYNEAIRDLALGEDIAGRLNDSLLLANVYNLQGLLQENIRYGTAARDYLHKALTWWSTPPIMCGRTWRRTASGRRSRPMGLGRRHSSAASNGATSSSSSRRPRTTS
ncbi:MAG: hypothetical protein ABI373_06810 [Flavobacteriales bacterium]